MSHRQAGAFFGQQLEEQLEPVRNLLFDDILGHAHALGDLPLRETVDLAQQEDTAAPIGQLVDETPYESELLSRCEGAFGRGFVI